MHKIIKQTFSTDGKLPSIKWFKRNIALDGCHSISTINKTTKTMYLRSEYTNHSFPILSKEWIEHAASYCKQFNKVHELAAGGGWLTYWLLEHGVNVENCTDDFSWTKISYNDWVAKKDSIKAVKEHQEVDLFILSWPYMDNMAANIFKAMKPNQRLLYIGEGWGGCTADDEFFKLTEEQEEETDLHKNFISFWGVHDCPSVYKKE